MILPKLDLRGCTNLEVAMQRVGEHCLFGKLILCCSEPEFEFVSGLIYEFGSIDFTIEFTGISPDQALRLLNDGAHRILLTREGHRLLPAFLDSVPADRIALVCDSIDRANTALEQGVDVQWVSENLSEAMSFLGETLAQDSMDPARVSIAWAGGTSDEGEAVGLDSVSLIEVVAQLDQLQTDCVISSSRLTPKATAQILERLLRSDRPDGLYPTVIVDRMGVALGLAYSNLESISKALEIRQGVYWSRSRNGLWIKGHSSGSTQTLHGISLDCDRDCLRFEVAQAGKGFCHLDTYTCFGKQRSIQSVMNRLAERINGPDEKSFTKKLIADPKMLETKLIEEAGELAEATSPTDVRWEAADLLYFSLIKMTDQRVSLDAIFSELTRRMNRVVRRKNKLESNNQTPEK